MEKTLCMAQRGGGSLVGISVKGSNLQRKVGSLRRKEGRGGGGVRMTRFSAACVRGVPPTVNRNETKEPY